jgi:hypothetical protein
MKIGHRKKRNDFASYNRIQTEIERNTRLTYSDEENKENSVAIPRTKTLTCRLPIELLKAVQYQAKVRGTTTTEMVKFWLQAGLDERETAARRHADMLFEVVKTRAFIGRIADAQIDPIEVEKMVDEAEADAQEYVKRRLEKAQGTA